jgi:HTH-type transcriptional regulator/antitoxin HigA
MIATAIEKDTLKGLDTPKPIASQAQNERYTALLLKMERQKHLTATEKAYMEVLTLLVEAYEDEHCPIDDASPREVLAELIAANELRQKDLVPSVFGSEGVVSDILSGRQELNLGHIERLSKRFNVSPEVFFKKRK